MTRGGATALRFLSRSWSRLRDLGLVALIAHSLLSAAGPWIALIAALAITAITALVMATSASTHAKAVSTENRLGAHIASVTSQKGQGAGITFPDLVQTKTGSAQVFGGEPTIQSGVSQQTGQYTVTSGGQQGGAAAHTHLVTLPVLNPSNHTHGYGHSHFNQMATDYNNLMVQLTNLKAKLVAAGIL